MIYTLAIGIEDSGSKKAIELIEKYGTCNET
jgi:hypothetical protein